MDGRYYRSARGVKPERALASHPGTILASGDGMSFSRATSMPAS